MLKKKKKLRAWCILFDLWKRPDAWKAKRRETGRRGGGGGVQGARERGLSVFFKCKALPSDTCHRVGMNPLSVWQEVRKLGPADRNSKEECMQIAAAKGNGRPQCLRGGQMKMAPASLTDSPLEDNSGIKSRWKFPF